MGAGDGVPEHFTGDPEVRWRADITYGLRQLRADREADRTELASLAAVQKEQRHDHGRLRAAVTRLQVLVGLLAAAAGAALWILIQEFIQRRV